jgi:hypothetical protein
MYVINMNQYRTNHEEHSTRRTKLEFHMQIAAWFVCLYKLLFVSIAPFSQIFPCSFLTSFLSIPSPHRKKYNIYARSIFLGSSIISLMRTRKVTASRPSRMRWS